MGIVNARPTKYAHPREISLLDQNGTSDQWEVSLLFLDAR
jgi:hypothetical protein